MERSGSPGTDSHELIFSHHAWLLRQVPRRAIGAEVDEAEGSRGSGIVNSLEAFDCAVLTHTLDLSEVEVACSEGRHSDSP